MMCWATENGVAVLDDEDGEYDGVVDDVGDDGCDENRGA